MREAARSSTHRLFRNLKVLTAQEESTTDAKVNDGIALVFKKYGRKVPRSITQRLKKLGLRKQPRQLHFIQ